MSSSDHEDGVTASQCIAVKETILQLLNSPLTSEDALHLIDCFDYSLLKSTCADIRRLAGTFSMFLLCLLADTPSKLLSSRRLVRGPFISRGRIVHLSATPLGDFSKERTYLDALSQAELPTDDKILFFFGDRSAKRSVSSSRSLLSCVTIRQLLRSLGSKAFVSSLPDPQKTPILAYLDERETDILSGFSFSYHIRPSYRPACFSEFCQATAISSVLRPCQPKPMFIWASDKTPTNFKTTDHQPHVSTSSEERRFSMMSEQPASLSFEKTYKSESTEESNSNRMRLTSKPRAADRRAPAPRKAQPGVDLILASMDEGISRVLNNFMKSSLRSRSKLHKTSMKPRQPNSMPISRPQPTSSNNFLHTFNSTSSIEDKACPPSRLRYATCEKLDHKESGASLPKNLRIQKSTNPQPQLHTTLTSIDYSEPLVTKNSNEKLLDAHMRGNRRIISSSEHRNYQNQLNSPNWKVNTKVSRRQLSTSLDYTCKATFRINTVTRIKPLSEPMYSQPCKSKKRVTFQDPLPFDNSEKAVDSGSGEAPKSLENDTAKKSSKKPFFFRKQNKYVQLPAHS